MSRKGFTLIELILVVLIVGLTAAFAIPSFVRSYQGAKLRTSARSVVMAHRFARSVAVLQQKYVAVYYYSSKNKIEVVSLAPESAGSSPSLAEGYTEGTYRVNTELERYLEEGVRILEFEIEKDGQIEKEAYWANYYPNGMSDAYGIRLADNLDKTLFIKMDALSGKAEVEGLDE